MKPKEFDELVRQKFDQNDFEYNPRNWERLADELDGRSKKRSMIMGWWMPLIGIAASITLAMGVAFLMHQGIGGPSVAKNKAGQNKNTKYTEQVQNNMIVSKPSVDAYATDAGLPVNTLYASTRNAKHTHNHVNENNDNAKYVFAIKLQYALGSEVKHVVRPFDFMKGDKIVKENDEKKELATKKGVRTFRDEAAPAKAPKMSLMLLGGINNGSQNTGYMAGANVRRMISDKVYLESDVAFASGSNSQSSVLATTTSKPGPTTSKLAGRYAGRTAINTDSLGNASLKTSSDNNPSLIYTTTYQSEEATYNVNYLQVSPALGYKVMKKLSVGLGPDFEQMLSGNGPAISKNEGNVREALVSESPSFDIGFVGKTEYSVTKNIKAGVSYRKGMNNFITPTATDKYIDRDYFMVQLKWAVFNK